MKKTTLHALALGLGLVGAAGMLFLSGCTKQQGPLSPSMASVGTGNSNAARLPRVSSFSPGTGGSVDPHQKVFVDFDSAMDPASFSTTTVKMYNLRNVGLGTSGYYVTEDEVTNFVFGYDVASRRLTLTHGSGAWPTNTCYRVLLTNGIHSVVGKPLDGNHNNIAESSEFDNTTNYFTVGAPTTGGYSLAPLALTSLTVESGWSNSFDYKGSFTAGSNANIGVATFVTITATFNAPLDVLPTNNNAGSMLTNADTGALISPVAIVFWPTADVGGNSFGAVYQLDPSTRYKLNIAGGLSGFISSTDNVLGHSPIFGRYFDGNSNGRAEAKDDYTVYLTTAQQSGTGQPSLTVNGTYLSYDSSARKFTILFNATGLSNDRLDVTTLNAANIQLLASYNGQSFAVTPKQIVFNGLWTVEVYLPDSFYPNDGSAVDMTVKVLHNVRSTSLVYLDQDGPGPDNDFTASTSTTVTSY